MSVLTLAEAKTRLSITDTGADNTLPAIIDSAEATLAQRVGPLAPTTVTRRIQGGDWQLVLPVTPAISMTSITPRSGTALDLSQLYLNTTTGMVTYNTLSPFVAAYYDVVYSAGRTVCPDDLLSAIAEVVAHLWEPRRGPNTRNTAPLPGAAHVLPYRVDELIAPHLQIPVG